MKLYHGTNVNLTSLAIHSWVTNDYDIALGFAEDKVLLFGGNIHVYVVELDESNVDWDIISMACGIEDDRGTTLIHVDSFTPVMLP